MIRSTSARSSGVLAESSGGADRGVLLRDEERLAGAEPRAGAPLVIRQIGTSDLEVRDRDPGSRDRSASIGCDRRDERAGRGHGDRREGACRLTGANEGARLQSAPRQPEGRREIPAARALAIPPLRGRWHQ